MDLLVQVKVHVLVQRACALRVDMLEEGSEGRKEVNSPKLMYDSGHRGVGEARAFGNTICASNIDLFIWFLGVRCVWECSGLANHVNGFLFTAALINITCTRCPPMKVSTKCMDLFLSGDPFSHLDDVVSTAAGTISDLGEINMELFWQLGVESISSTTGLD
ncbi:hypothetical protein K439DRAFT_1613260 [Ramaria rubella]|nr:hypothetical protein K439DRAFT_1613260 [Ramaria rubella]